ncbi:MAG: HD domain-containing protein [Anaerolineales bacterium]|nr:HD domain-containing protein [Anaerolineales bacterium]
MTRSRPFYRVRQFWDTVRAQEPADEELAPAREILTPKQMGLFQIMHPSDKSHALDVFSKLQARGENNPDLLSAALLHDVGKIRYPMSAWDRAVVVIGQALFPYRSKIWGQGKPRGWKRPFVAAEQHAYWGARMAAESGVSTLTVHLIWRHHEAPSIIPETEEDLLLRTLQAADDDS